MFFAHASINSCSRFRIRIRSAMWSGSHPSKIRSINSSRMPLQLGSCALSIEFLRVFRKVEKLRFETVVIVELPIARPHHPVLHTARNERVHLPRLGWLTCRNRPTSRSCSIR